MILRIKTGSVSFCVSCLFIRFMSVLVVSGQYSAVGLVPRSGGNLLMIHFLAASSAFSFQF